jgi:hypothetical protein
LLLKIAKLHLLVQDFFTINYLALRDIIQDNLLNNESISHLQYHNSNNKV